MNAREVNVWLTAAAHLDARMKRVDPIEQANMATVWAKVLDDVSVADAMAALRSHYRASRESIMPADILTLVGIRDEAPSTLMDVTGEVISDSRARMLAAAGVTEAEYQAHESDRAWVLDKFRPVLAQIDQPEVFQ